MIKYAKSKFGRIRFDYKDDADKSINRGWVVDRVDAYLDDKPVGYLKISYIPDSEVRDYLPDVIHYLGADHKGYSEIKNALKNKDKKSLTRALSRLQDPWSDWIENLESRGSLKHADEKWWEDQYKRLSKEVNRKYKKEYEGFLEDTHNKPLVDYIKVEKDYQQGGIGFGLYIAGAMWMAKKGMCLYASSLQSPEAKKSWDKMKKIGLPIKTVNQKNGRTRMCLDYR